MTDFWVATYNPGKLSEIKTLLHRLPLTIHSARELSYYSAPPETGKTFKENALIKARSLKAVLPQAWVLAEDSGLEVLGLQGMPGIHSARYAGDHASDAENTAKVLKMVSLRCPQKREAAFHATLICIDPQGNEHEFEGRLEGNIALRETGKEGFGYDPIFIPKGETKTTAELGLAYKNKFSHRAQAIEKLKIFLISQLTPNIS